MWHGKATPITLNADLTRYHRHLVPGVTGTLVPFHKTTVWGNQDRFGAVRFDCCGATLDIVLSNLTIHGTTVEAPPTPTPRSHPPSTRNWRPTWPEKTEADIAIEEAEKLAALKV